MATNIITWGGDVATGPIDEYIKGMKRTKSVATLLREIIVLIVQNDEHECNHVGQ
jgi:hypothetical protein